MLCACAAICLAVLAAAAQVVLLAFTCYRARRKYLSSPIPGPPLLSKLFGGSTFTIHVDAFTLNCHAWHAVSHCICSNDCTVHMWTMTSLQSRALKSQPVAAFVVLWHRLCMPSSAQPRQPTALSACKQPDPTWGQGAAPQQHPRLLCVRPAAWVLVGHVPAFIGPKGPWSFLQWTAEFGPLYKLQLVDAFVVVLTDPDTIARITKKTGARS